MERGRAVRPPARLGPAAWWRTGRSAAGGFDRRFWVLCSGFLASSMGFAMVIPFISLYFHEELGVPMSRVGLVFLVTAVIRAAFQAIAGDLSDRLGRARLMSAGQAARALCFFALAGTVFARAGFLPTAGVLLLSYIAGAFYMPVASAAVADLAPPDRRLTAYAILRIFDNVGWGIGPMLGGMVADFGFGWLFVLGAAISAVSAGLVARHLRETLRPPAEGAVRSIIDEAGGAASPGSTRDSGSRGGLGSTGSSESAGSFEATGGFETTGGTEGAGGTESAGSPRWAARSGATHSAAGSRRWFGHGLLSVRHDRTFLLFCALSLLVFLTMSQWLTTLSVYASGQLGITKRQLGALFGINGLMVVALQLPVTRGLRRLSLVGSLTLGAAVYAVSFLGLAFARTWLHLVAGMVAITLAELIFSPPSVALVSLIAPPERTGRYMGIYSLVTAFGWSAGPFVGGLLLDRWVEEPLRLWGSVAALGAAGAVGFAATRRRYRTRMPS